MEDEPSLKIRLEKFKIPIALSLLGLVLILGGVISNKKDRVYPVESFVNSKVIVDVSGAVFNPGVYELEEGSRFEDAVKKAGGLQPEASNEFISKHLNLAQKVSDGIKIYIPFEGEEVGVLGGSVALVNINTAAQSELESLSGVGSVTASKIISNRPYQSIDDLLTKKVVGKSTFEKIKDNITFY